MPTIRLLAVFAENRPGQTARVTRILADAKISIRWVTIVSQGSFGVMKFLVSDPERAQQVLSRHGLMTSFLGVLPVEVADEPGTLCAVAECLAAGGVNLDNTSGFVANGRAVILVEAHDLEPAFGLLQQKGFRVLTREELLAT
jgi:hypothetical protein